MSDQSNLISCTVIDRIQCIDWFARCGKAEPIDQLPIPTRQIESWDTARTWYTHDDWEAVQMQARNSLTMYLNSNHRQEFQTWSLYTLEAKRRIVNEVTERAEGFAAERHEPVSFVHNVQWDVLAAIMELAYAHCDPPLFYVHLLRVYEAGHFPCGWDGQWPSGTLLYI